MSVDLPDISSEWDSIQESLLAVRAVGDDFEGFFDQTFSELESMCKLLDRHEQCLQQSAREQLDQSSQADGEKESQLARLLEESRQQKAELEQQQALLETELEAVRGRAAQTDRLLGEQRKEAATQQSGWAAELKNMRTALEQVSARIGSERASMAATAASPAPEPSSAPASVAAPTAVAAHASHASQPASPQAAAETPSGNAGDDVVLDSVMAQFQMLQKDVARRRENAPG